MTAHQELEVKFKVLLIVQFVNRAKLEQYLKPVLVLVPIAYVESIQLRQVNLRVQNVVLEGMALESPMMLQQMVASNVQ